MAHPTFLDQSLAKELPNLQVVDAEERDSSCGVPFIGFRSPLRRPRASYWSSAQAPYYMGLVRPSGHWLTGDHVTCKGYLRRREHGATHA